MVGIASSAELVDSIGSIRRFGYSFCVTAVPGGCTPILDGGGCTMISGSIPALIKGVASTALGTIIICGSASGIACHPGGSLLKSRLGEGASTRGVRARLSAVTGAGTPDWQSAVVP